MKRPPFQPGLAQLTDKVFTYLQPDGGLGLSNAGLVGSKRDALLIDTFFDLPHTQRMLDDIARSVTSDIGRVVNTHHNGDHCWGNQLVTGAEIIGHRRCAELMATLPPESLQRLKLAPDTIPAARALRAGLERFDFSGITLTPPTTFVPDEGLTLARRRRRARADLRRAGAHRRRRDRAPAEGGRRVHRRRDLPPVRADRLGRNLRALDRRARAHRGAGRATIVPGHGPVCGPEGALELRDYLVYVRDESARHFASGASVAEAAARIDLGPFADWLESERIVFSVDRAYRELRGEPYDAPVDFGGLMVIAAKVREQHEAARAGRG